MVRHCAICDISMIGIGSQGPLCVRCTGLYPEELAAAEREVRSEMHEAVRDAEVEAKLIQDLEQAIQRLQAKASARTADDDHEDRGWLRVT